MGEEGNSGRAHLEREMLLGLDEGDEIKVVSQARRESTVKQNSTRWYRHSSST